MDGCMKIWDSGSGECLESIQQFQDGEFVWTRGEAEVRRVSPGFWKHFDWRIVDAQTGQYVLLPPEQFGPLPVQEPE
jgi:hypothetical protein